MAAGNQSDPHLTSALKKLLKKEPLTQREQAAYARHEKKFKEKYGPAYVRECPKKDVIAEGGVSSKTMLEWVDRFGAPWVPHDKTSDLFSLWRWAVTLIAESSDVIFKRRRQAQAKAGVDEFFPDLDEETDWQQECFREKALELRDKRHLRERTTVDTASLGDVLLPAADGFRTVVEQVGKQAGPELGPKLQRLLLNWWQGYETSCISLITRDDGDGK